MLILPLCQIRSHDFVFFEMWDILIAFLGFPIDSHFGEMIFSRASAIARALFIFLHFYGFGIYCLYKCLRAPHSASAGEIISHPLKYISQRIFCALPNSSREIVPLCLKNLLLSIVRIWERRRDEIRGWPCPSSNCTLESQR